MSITSFSFTNIENLWSIPNSNDIGGAHQGISTDGSHFYETNSTGLVKRDLSGNIVSSTIDMNALWDGEPMTSNGNPTFHDGHLYIPLYKSSPHRSVVVKIDPSDLSFVEKWDLTENFTYSLNGIVFWNGYWYIAEATPSTATPTIKVFNPDFTYNKVAYTSPVSFNLGYQGSALFRNTMVVTDHNGNFLMFKQNEDLTVTLIDTYDSGMSDSQGVCFLKNDIVYGDRGNFMKRANMRIIRGQGESKVLFI